MFSGVVFQFHNNNFNFTTGWPSWPSFQGRSLIKVYIWYNSVTTMTYSWPSFQGWASNSINENKSFTLQQGDHFSRKNHIKTCEVADAHVSSLVSLFDHSAISVKIIILVKYEVVKYHSHSRKKSVCGKKAWCKFMYFSKTEYHKPSYNMLETTKYSVCVHAHACVRVCVCEYVSVWAQ